MTEQLDIFEPDTALVERLAEIAFDAWSGAWATLPDFLRWGDLRSEGPKDKFRAVARAILAEQAKGVA
ncbi:MAG: hypothetical protein WAW17_31170 [Rhodococcus sp. (in: high G+C Gram-positive bacteria)]|uniref:hypothetical protein n=1 Tax=Rhodococcus sp. TaxID=1831 RepID=UPI003BAF21F9